MSNKIILQNTSGTILKNENSYLLIKRSSDRKIAPNLWSCVGGHMEKEKGCKLVLTKYEDTSHFSITKYFMLNNKKMLTDIGSNK